MSSLSLFVFFTFQGFYLGRVQVVKSIYLKRIFISLCIFPSHSPEPTISDIYLVHFKTILKAESLAT